MDRSLPSVIKHWHKQTMNEEIAYCNFLQPTLLNIAHGLWAFRTSFHTIIRIWLHCYWLIKHTLDKLLWLAYVFILERCYYHEPVLLYKLIPYIWFPPSTNKIRAERPGSMHSAAVSRRRCSGGACQGLWQQLAVERALSVSSTHCRNGGGGVGRRLADRPAIRGWVYQSLYILYFTFKNKALAIALRSETLSL
jgi:hypothetical protein